jgi:hypothetical protein
MSSASQASTYEIFKIQKKGRPAIDITGQEKIGPKTVGFNYYESLFSPSVTATLSVIETGSSVNYDPKYDSQSRIGTLSSALPLSGDVSVAFKIRSKYGILDFTKNSLLFDKIISPGSESNREAIIMNLVSKNFKLNEEATVYKKYSGNIGNSVRGLIEEYLKTNVAVDQTKNSYSFIGNGKSPFEIICKLASKSIPGKGNPGYFFYETRSGLNFKSIDELIRQQPVASYYRTDVLRSNIDNDENDFKILFKTDVRKSDLANLLRSGAIYSKNVFFDPQSFKYEEKIENLSENLSTSLGKDPVLPTVSSFTRTHFHIKDIGALSQKILDDVNNDPKEWQARSTMRYNMLFSQAIQIQVPCNIKLKAGDIIICNFEAVTSDSKIQGPDPVMSGKYLIVNLCHHFDPLRSFTSLTLARDSYGLYTNKSK